MSEQWNRWKPIKELEKKYKIVNISENLNGFSIELVSTNKEQNTMSLIFEQSVNAYRFADQEFKQNIINSLTKEYSEEYFKEWTFFKVDNSSYIEWLSEQSLGWSDEFPFIHFSLVGYDSILDIACDYEPKIILQQENK